MLPDRVSNPGPLTYESGALPIALRGPAYANANVRLELKPSVTTGVRQNDIKPILLRQQN